MKRVIVVGGGLGGLVVAGLLGRRGYHVTLLERSPIVGGRSHTMSKDGFTLPYGAHAVLVPKVEPMRAIFNELDIRLNYNKPSMSKFKLFSEGKIISSPLSAGALTTPAINGFFNHFIFFRKFLQMVKAKPGLDGDFTVQQWINQHITEPSIAKVIRAYAALTVYDGALDQFSMNAFLELTNMEYSTSQPLGYVGYAELLEQLRRSILKHGGEIRLACEAKELLIVDGRAAGVATAAATLSADAVVLNLPPQAVAKLAGKSTLSEELKPILNQSPQYVYVHDVMLSEQIRKDVTNLLDLDESVYLNDYSLNVPGSAPQGSQLLAFLKFLTADEQKDDSHAERSQKSVERILDSVYPGWRTRLTGTRTIHRAAVNGIARHIGNRLLPFASRNVGSLFFVGDSTAGRGALGLPAYDSARTVADIISNSLPENKAIHA